MIYQLPNGRIIEISTEMYFELTDEEIMDLNGSAKCDARTAVNLSGVANVVNKAYMRLKFILSAANPGDVDITCRLVNLPAVARITHTVAL